MNYSLFPNHYHLTSASQFPAVYQEPFAYYPYPSYQQIPYSSFQPVWANYRPANTNQPVDIILIAILILVSLDLIFVRPLKK